MITNHNKKAAIEMSIGTIVVIVLAMSMLILGLVLVRTIFTGTTQNVAQIDEKVKAEIAKVFAEDSLKTIVIYPSTKSITLKQGDNGNGFAFSLRNIDTSSSKTLSYHVIAGEESTGCANGFNSLDLITLGKDGEGIALGPGKAMDSPEMVRLKIPETFLQLVHSDIESMFYLMVLHRLQILLMLQSQQHNL